MNTVAIVQARVNSMRLPGKVLAHIDGEPMIVHILRRLSECDSLDEIIVGTGSTRANELLRDAVLMEGFDCPFTYRAERDVLGRYYDLAVEYDADVIVRITGDCPLIDPDIVDEVVDQLGDSDFSTNVLHRTYPKGLDTEVMTFKTLKWLEESVKDHEMREHVTQFVYRQSDNFVIHSLQDIEDHHKLRWCVDYEEDLEHVRDIYRWMNGSRLGYREILQYELRKDGRSSGQDSL